MDIVGGAGVLFQHHERRVAPCFSGCANTIEETLENRAPVFALGIEVPILPASRVAVSPFVRLYWLRRGEHVTELPDSIPFQYEWRSSTRVAFGVTGRLVW
jgi:hypothetical protein